MLVGRDCDTGFIGNELALGLNSGALRLNGDEDNILGIKSGIVAGLLGSSLAMEDVNVTERGL